LKVYKIKRKKGLSLTSNEIDRLFQIELSCKNDMTPIYETRKKLKENVIGSGAINFLLYSDDVLIGYATTHTIENEFYFANLAVLKEYRGQGLGKRLVGEQLEYANKEAAPRISVHCALRNGIAQSIYYKFGFRKEKIEEGYYPNGEDALVLFKNKKEARKWEE
jgi:ribosomal protein S18 acetylase RimI-like enzyme